MGVATHMTPRTSRPRGAQLNLLAIVLAVAPCIAIGQDLSGMPGSAELKEVIRALDFSASGFESVPDYVIPPQPVAAEQTNEPAPP